MLGSGSKVVKIDGSPLSEEALAANDAVVRAQQEPDPEIAEELWSEAILLDPRNPEGWAARGAVRVQLMLWQDACDDLQTAADLYGNKVTPGLLNTLGVAQGQCMQWELAVRSFEGAARLLRDEDVAPPLPEPRGGANRLSQLASLNLALARFQTGDAQFAVARTKLLLAEDPAYWDARAALAAFLWDQGQPEAAEGEWAALCSPSGPLEMGTWVTRNGTPDQKGNPAKGAVPQSAAQKLYLGPLSRITQLLTEVEDINLSNRCEDYNTGLELPCNDAGIPGLGGANEPCVLYTREEVERRRWPPRAVEALTAFLQQDELVQAKQLQTMSLR